MSRPSCGFASQLKADAEAVAAGNAVALTVAIAVVVNEAELLLVCRRGPRHERHHLAIPCQHRQARRHPAMVAVRETLAETGIHCSVRTELGSRVHPLSGVNAQYFLCDYLVGAAENRDVIENASALWVPKSDLVRFIPAERIFAPILRALKEET
jgi:8-oxo-dGTP diphosphatase